MVVIKFCKKCKILKPVEDFSKRSDSKDGYRNECKSCRKKYYEKNRHYIIKRNSFYQKKNRQRASIYQKQWRFKNKDYLRCYDSIRKREKRKNDPLFKFKANIRGLIYHAIHDKGYKKTTRSFKILGDYFENVWDYLLKKAKNRYSDFKLEDFLESNKYHIDHIIPLSNAKNEEDVIKLCHYTNLQIVTKEDNLKKSCKIV